MWWYSWTKFYVVLILVKWALFNNMEMCLCGVYRSQRVSEIGTSMAYAFLNTCRLLLFYYRVVRPVGKQHEMHGRMLLSHGLTIIM